jgi:hypothetical protein
MGKKSREKRERRMLSQTEPIFGGGLIRSVSFVANQDGKLELADKYERPGFRPYDNGGIPVEIKDTLRGDIDSNELENLFDLYIAGVEDIDNKIEDSVIGPLLCSLINGLLSDIKNANDAEDDPENEEKHFLQYISGPPANIVLSLSVDRRVAALWQSINLKEFTLKEKGVWVSKETSESYPAINEKLDSLGFEYRLITSGGRSTLTDFSKFSQKSENSDALEILKVIMTDKQKTTTSPLWNSVDHYLLYEICIGPFDRLPSQIRETHPNRGWIDKNGKVIPPHSKRNPRRRLKSRDLLNDKIHVVYIARDKDGVIRYIGEGERSRPSHVNSGISHVYNLNREHFSGRNMEVEIFSEKLTKIEALTIEKLLLKKYFGCGLWNTKDYEA